MPLNLSGLLLIGRRGLRSMNSHLHNVPVLARGSERCRLLIHSADARRLGMADGARARVRSRVGELVVPVAVDDDLMPGVVSLPHGYGHAVAGSRQRVAATLQPGANANALTDDLPFDPISGTCGASGIPVEVTPTLARRAKLSELLPAPRARAGPGARRSARRPGR